MPITRLAGVACIIRIMIFMGISLSCKGTRKTLFCLSELRPCVSAAAMNYRAMVPLIVLAKMWSSAGNADRR